MNEANNQDRSAAFTTAHASSRPVNLPPPIFFSMIWQMIAMPLDPLDDNRARSSHRDARDLCSGLP